MIWPDEPAINNLKKANFAAIDRLNQFILELTELFELYPNHRNLKALASLVKDDKSQVIRLEGVKGSLVGIIFSSLIKTTNQLYMVVMNDAEEAGYLYHDITQICGESDAFFFPSSYKRAIKYGQIDHANAILRTEALNRLRQANGASVIVTYPDALAEKVVSDTTLSSKTLRIAQNESVDSVFVADVLYEYGFERVEYVYEPGQYAVRGSILDVFSFSHEFPYRIDFFGDEVESIRTFDVETQLSKEKLTEIFIIPNLESDEMEGVSLMEFLPENCMLGIQDLAWIKGRVEGIVAEGISPQAIQSEDYDEQLTKKLVDPKTFARDLIRFRRIDFGAKTLAQAPSILTFDSSIQPPFHKNFDLVAEFCHSVLADNYKLYILSDSIKQTQRLESIFEERGDNIPFTPVLKTLHEGFIDHDLKIACLTDHQIFDRFHKYNLKSDKARSGKIALSIKELNQFENGDYIVHIDHGVGKFGGLIRTEINGRMQEVIKLIFQNEDILFVSIHSLHKLSKYRGKEGEPPRVNKLGTGAWEKMKDRTKAKVKDIARDLIKLYAERREEKGFSFSHDTYMQQELEASFIYEDTPDQLKSTADVKRDMESMRPMDRLICGDVGFGKTEVAVRAAFKAVADSKQVAILVPTTVLALQHYKTFSERLKEFPCRVDYVSRARTAKDIKQIIKDLHEGKIDVLVGTHRLISKDIQFKDLGLLIVDEEQKFGVSVKEKLRQLKVNVDTLTMTATPIPRTLQFSLMGARDLSVIQTPPSNRYPIQTEVHAFNEEILKEAILFEMSRNGQIFVLNNRISSIYDLENTIKRLVPDARTIVGHGQMDPHTLEQIILDFANYEFDVLIATSIIESGLDIPNANTIIVNNAQNFGLSDLHQLRGRVGRSNKKAFCYLFAPPLHMLSAESRRRLQAIENFSELGSGIHIAMQDLDIRGAGNMLGGEQSGFIADLGYETYQKILQEAVTELKNEEFSDLYEEVETEEEHHGKERLYVTDTVIESDMELLFPNEYIPNDSERISLYRELDNMEEESDIQAFVARLKDRFGRVPQQGKELIRIVRLRRLAKKLGIEKLALKNERAFAYFVSDNDSPYYQSEAFGKVLAFMTENHKICQLRDKNGKRSMVLSQVNSVEKAVDMLQRMLG